MIWTSWSDFISMGGYAFFVWGSYSVTFIFIAVEIIAVLRQRKIVKQRISQFVHSGNVEHSNNEQ